MGKPIRIHLTYKDYLDMPEDGNRYEILDGELAVTPTPTLSHQLASGELHLLFRSWTKVAGGLVIYAPATVYLAKDTILEPDLFWISADNLPHRSDGKIVRGAPDLVVEILSPGTQSRDRGAKQQLYARFGVREYWLVNPMKRSVEIYTLAGGALVLHAGGSGEAPLASAMDARLVVHPARLFVTWSGGSSSV